MKRKIKRKSRGFGSLRGREKNEYRIDNQRNQSYEQRVHPNKGINLFFFKERFQMMESNAEEKQGNPKRTHTHTHTRNQKQNKTEKCCMMTAYIIIIM